MPQTVSVKKLIKKGLPSFASCTSRCRESLSPFTHLWKEGNFWKLPAKMEVQGCCENSRVEIPSSVIYEWYGIGVIAFNPEWLLVSSFPTNVQFVITPHEKGKRCGVVFRGEEVIIANNWGDEPTALVHSVWLERLLSKSPISFHSGLLGAIEEVSSRCSCCLERDNEWEQELARVIAELYYDFI